MIVDSITFWQDLNKRDNFRLALEGTCPCGVKGYLGEEPVYIKHSQKCNHE
jgi:hypothetical protein